MVLAALVFGSGCQKSAVIDGSSQESFWRSVGAINKTLPREELAAFQFALTKLRKHGYTEDELARMPEAPLDPRFLDTVNGKTVKEVLQIAERLPEAVPERPTKQSN